MLVSLVFFRIVSFLNMTVSRNFVTVEITCPMKSEKSRLVEKGEVVHLKNVTQWLRILNLSSWIFAKFVL